MPGGRVPSRLLITSRCGGWFEQNEKETRAQRGYHCGLGGWGEQGRLHTRRRHPNAFCYFLFSFLPIFQAQTHPGRQRRRFLKKIFFFFFPPSPDMTMLRGLWASTVPAGFPKCSVCLGSQPRPDPRSGVKASPLSSEPTLFSRSNFLPGQFPPPQF